MSMHTGKTRTSRQHRVKRKFGTWFLGFLVLALAGIILFGPRLFAQDTTQPEVITHHMTVAQGTEPPGGAPIDPAAPAEPGMVAEPPAHEGGGEAIQLPWADEALVPLYIVLGAAVLALLFGFFWMKKTLAHDPGSERMQGVATAVQEGAMAYLARQVKTMIPLVIAIMIGLFFLYLNQYQAIAPEEATTLAIGVAMAFLLGVAASYAAGYVGMGIAVRGNVRVANAALSSFKRALEIAFQAGAVSGMFTVGLGLLGATITFLVFKENAMFVLVGFGFGGSLAALFMRVGGGIFTKAADVGADLVGKVEAGIPEDDPRNAATIADNVGDNVGDCAGMAADVFESYEVTLVAAIILAAAVGFTLAGVVDAGGAPIFGGLLTAGSFTAVFTLKLVIYALLVRAVGVVASIIGVLAVKGKDDPTMNPMHPINIGQYVSIAIAALGFVVVSYLVFATPAFGALPALPALPAAAPAASAAAYNVLAPIIQGFWYLAFVATALGIVLTFVIAKLTEYFTADDKKPVTEIASAARTGPATLILSGLAEGLESSVWGIVAIAVTIFGAFVIFPDPAFAAYAIALTGLGLLATTGYVLAMDTYGPISDNANGIFEMSGALKNADGTENKAAHNVVARLDMVGNTTKALTKGFAIATAVIAAVALYRSFLDTVAGAQLAAAARGVPNMLIGGEAAVLVRNIQVNLPDVFVGLLIGGAVPFLFSSFAIRAVSRAAVQLVEEVRRQFRTIPGIWEYTGVGEKGKPDYARCVAISTAAAQKELLGPGLLAVFSPILVGFWLGAYALGGFLAGAILVGQLMAVFMSNTGGAWDNAKKKIEDGFLGGKGSDAHKAGVIGDTVGDPLKDTAGPALNPMIKVMNLIAILVAPATIQLQDSAMKWVVVAVALIVLIIAVSFSKRGGVETASEESSAVSREG
ncbi:MAG: sodium-translocating pyrophosphatase [Armatimonadota bacterium]